MSNKPKTWVEIYNDVDFIKRNHEQLFFTEMQEKLGLSSIRLSRILKELNITTLTIDSCDKKLKYRDYTKKPKRKYNKRKKLKWYQKIFK
jgi:hypothetical protein